MQSQSHSLSSCILNRLWSGIYLFVQFIAKKLFPVCHSVFSQSLLGPLGSLLSQTKLSLLKVCAVLVVALVVRLFLPS